MMRSLVNSFSLLVFLLNIFTLHGMAYRIDKSCDKYRSMIDAAYKEAMTMNTKARDSIQGERWIAPNALLGDIVGNLFPNSLTDSDRADIQGLPFNPEIFVICTDNRVAPQANLPRF
jgi:hypothetical protein